MRLNSRRDIVFILLGGIFITNALVAELIGVKLIQIGPFAMSIGVIAWPVVFLTTDLINEYFGVVGVRRLTYLTMGLIIYTFVLVYLAMMIPAAPFSPVSDPIFNQVFGQSQWIMIGSVIAFAISQLIDVAVFWLLRGKTGGKMLWLRSTGSTVVSQLIDSIVIIGIAFWIPGKIKTEEFWNVALSNYSYKLLIAIGLTPMIYVVHGVIDRYLGREESQQLIQDAARSSMSSRR